MESFLDCVNLLPDLVQAFVLIFLGTVKAIFSAALRNETPYATMTILSLSKRVWMPGKRTDIKEKWHEDKKRHRMLE